MKRRRRVTIASSLIVLVLATAGSCDPGTVIENTPTYDSRGNKTCTIVVRPDDLDSAPFRLEDQRESRCKRCPKGARWPDCNKKEKPNAETTHGGVGHPGATVRRLDDRLAGAGR